MPLRPTRPCIPLPQSPNSTSPPTSSSGMTTTPLRLSPTTSRTLPPPLPTLLTTKSIPFKATSTRRDLSTSYNSLKAAYPLLKNATVLHEQASRLAERAVEVLGAVTDALEVVEKREGEKDRTDTRTYQFDGGNGGDTVFRIQSILIDLLAFSNDYTSSSTSSRLALFVHGIPSLHSSLSTLTRSLISSISFYSLSSPTTTSWESEDALDRSKDLEALPRLFRLSIALRGPIYEEFLLERSGSAAMEVGKRREEFCEWCMEKNESLRPREGMSPVRTWTMTLPASPTSPTGVEDTPTKKRRGTSEGMVGSASVTLVPYIYGPTGRRPESIISLTNSSPKKSNHLSSPLMTRSISSPFPPPSLPHFFEDPTSFAVVEPAAPTEVESASPDLPNSPVVDEEIVTDTAPGSPTPSGISMNSSYASHLFASPVFSDFTAPSEDGEHLVEDETSEKNVEKPKVNEEQSEVEVEHVAEAKLAEVDVVAPSPKVDAVKPVALDPEPRLDESVTPFEKTGVAQTPDAIESSPSPPSPQSSAPPSPQGEEAAPPAALSPTHRPTRSSSIPLASLPVSPLPLDPPAPPPSQKERDRERPLSVRIPPILTLRPATPLSQNSDSGPSSPVQAVRVLCLDGGGIRGLPLLLTLRSALGSLAKTPGEMPKPCEQFDLITGVGTGGLIALLLGRLRLSLDDAIELYICIAELSFRGKDRTATRSRWSKLFSSPSATEGRDANLERALKSFLPETPMMDDSEHTTECRTAVLAFQNGKAKWLRSYEDEAGDGHNSMTIQQVARATLASTPFFKPYSATPSLVFTDTNTSPNPSEATVDELHRQYGRGATISCFLSLGVGKVPTSSSGPAGVKASKTRLKALRFVAELEVQGARAAERFRGRARKEGWEDQLLRYSVDVGRVDPGVDEWSVLKPFAAAVETWMRTSHSLGSSSPLFRGLQGERPGYGSMRSRKSKSSKEPLRRSISLGNMDRMYIHDASGSTGSLV
ncbi:hypothetical protein P7C70_g656, partial [Phenoliferia sp. Uapishka_3]